MRIYFRESKLNNNEVIFAEDDTIKIFDGSPEGVIDGIEVESPDALKRFKKHFAAVGNKVKMDEYANTYESREITLKHGVLRDAELIYTDPQDYSVPGAIIKMNKSKADGSHAVGNMSDKAQEYYYGQDAVGVREYSDYDEALEQFVTLYAIDWGDGQIDKNLTFTMVELTFEQMQRVIEETEASIRKHLDGQETGEQ